MTCLVGTSTARAIELTTTTQTRCLSLIRGRAPADELFSQTPAEPQSQPAANASQTSGSTCAQLSAIKICTTGPTKFRGPAKCTPAVYSNFSGTASRLQYLLVPINRKHPRNHLYFGGHGFTTPSSLGSFATYNVYLQPCDQSGGYPMPPVQQHQQQFYRSPPRPPAENPYLNVRVNGSVQGEQYMPSNVVGGSHERQSPTAHQGYDKTTTTGFVNGSPSTGSYGGGGGGWGGGGGPDLPHGWEPKVLPDGRTMFIDHNTQVT